MKQLEDISSLLNVIQSNDVEALTLMEYCCACLLRDDSQLLRLSDKCHKIEESFKKTLPFHLNVISAAARGRLKETAHSIILHDLLHHPVILSSFLVEIVGIDGNTFSVSDIEYPDKDRIDLSLRSKEKYLIIENKVNSAEEQKGQLYRYATHAEETHKKDDIIILYLNPSSYEVPSLYSRSKDGNGNEDDYDTVNTDIITIKNYRYDIIAWLKKLADNSQIINESEPYLKSAILQYIDYLEEYFQTKDEYKELHEMIEKELRALLGIEDNLSLQTQIEILNDKKSSLERLTSEISAYLNKLQTQQAVERLESVAKELNEKFKGQITFKMYNLLEPEVGFDIEFNKQVMHVTITYTSAHEYWWRVYATQGIEDSTKHSIEELIIPVMGNVINGSKGTWDIYKQTSEQNCGLRISELAQLFQCNVDFKFL